MILQLKKVIELNFNEWYKEMKDKMSFKEIFEQIKHKANTWVKKKTISLIKR